MIRVGDMVLYRSGQPGRRHRRDPAHICVVVGMEGWNEVVDDQMVLLLHPDTDVSWELLHNLEAVT